MPVILKILKNAQVRILFSGSLFTVAFIWMAVTSYNVDKAEIKVFLIFSLLFVVGIIICGLLSSIFIGLFRRKKGGLLAKIEAEEALSKKSIAKD
ncbi:MAG: hypothetical protein KUG79_10535 [Pseudomonadales bacterium]|nr:hypothetical protein [Pseudomonadales bacterium]